MPAAASLADVVIAVDGPSGSGKSSTARGVAKRLGLRYLDTGAMYRAITWWLLAKDADLQDASAIAKRALEPQLELSVDPDAPRITVDGRDVDLAIRGAAVTAAVSAVAAVPEVRSRLVALQRELIGAGGIVVEGRDIGTTVAPNAAVKIFLTASPEARAQRRAAQLTPTEAAAIGTVADLARRDHLDSTRDVSPLARAQDAVVIDSSGYELDDVIEIILDLVAERLGVVSDG